MKDQVKHHLERKAQQDLIVGLREKRQDRALDDKGNLGRARRSPTPATLSAARYGTPSRAARPRAIRLRARA